MLAASPARCDSADANTHKWVEAVGAAQGIDEQAFELARKQAIRNALESACGVFLSSRTATANAAAARESILSHVDGYVSKVEVLERKSDDGKTTVKIKALVQTAKAAGDFAALRHAYKEANKPRVAVAIAEVRHDLFEKIVKNEDISIDIKTKLEAERRRFVDAQSAAAAIRQGDGTVVWGDFRRGRPRPRNWTAWSNEQKAAWISETAAQDYANAVAKIEQDVGYKRRRAYLDEVSETVESGGMVQGIVENYLLKHDVRVVNLTQTGDVRRREILLAGLSDDPRELVAIKAKLHADVVVTGTATARRVSEMTVGAGKLYRYRGEMVVRAVNADTGMMLMADTFTVNVNSAMATGGTDAALKAVGEKAAAEIVRSLAEAWDKNAAQGAGVKLTVTGMTFSQWVKFKEQARKWRGVRSVRLLGITAGQAEIDFSTDLSAELLAENIVQVAEPKIELTGFESSSLRGKMVSPDGAPQEKPAKKPVDTLPTFNE